MTLQPTRLRPTVVFLTAFYALIGNAIAVAGDASVYSQAPASRDGIGKFYAGREIAHVMGLEGAQWLERPERVAEERPDLLVEALKITPVMVVADIGAGSGYLTRRIAPLLTSGKIYAVDVQPEMVEMLKDLTKQQAMASVIPTLASNTDTHLPEGSVDLAFMVDVYHELEFPREVMLSIVKALKPGGQIVLVEYRAHDRRVPIKPLHTMSLSQLRREMQALPLAWERSFDRLPLQHMVFFRKR
jgi:SAM-dependent methyltransferase